MGPASTVCLGEVSVLEGDEVTRHREFYNNGNVVKIKTRVRDSSSASCEVTGKRLNRGSGYGLGVPCKYVFEGNRLAVKFLRECITREKNIL